MGSARGYGRGRNSGIGHSRIQPAASGDGIHAGGRDHPLQQRTFRFSGSRTKYDAGTLTCGGHARGWRGFHVHPGDGPGIDSGTCRANPASRRRADH